MNLNMFTPAQKREINKGKELGIDLTTFSDFNAAQMEQLRKGLEDHIDITAYANNKFTPSYMKYLRTVITHKNKYNDALIDVLMSGVFSPRQEEQLRLGIESDIDISIYATTDFSERQMEEIRLGLENHVDVTVYANAKNFSSDKMREIRKGLQKNLNINAYAFPSFTTSQMIGIRRCLEKGVDITTLLISFGGKNIKIDNDINRELLSILIELAKYFANIDN